MKLQNRRRALRPRIERGLPLWRILTAQRDLPKGTQDAAKVSTANRIMTSENNHAGNTVRKGVLFDPAGRRVPMQSQPDFHGLPVIFLETFPPADIVELLLNLGALSVEGITDARAWG